MIGKIIFTCQGSFHPASHLIDRNLDKDDNCQNLSKPPFIIIPFILLNQKRRIYAGIDKR